MPRLSAYSISPEIYKDVADTWGYLDDTRGLAYLLPKSHRARLFSLVELEDNRSFLHLAL